METTETNPKIRTFDHVRKGELTGFIVKNEANSEWITIQLVENFNPTLLSVTGGGYKDQYEKGEEITVRKSLISNL